MFTVPSGPCRQLLPNLWLGGLRALAVATLFVYALTFVGTAPPAQAVDFSDGDMRLSLDTTLSHGLTFRVEEPHENIGHYTLVNNNDGNLNYDTGLVSNTSKFTTDFDIGYRNVGAFVRLNGFIDFENENGERARTPLSDAAKDRVGTVVEVLGRLRYRHLRVRRNGDRPAPRPTRAQLGGEHIHPQRHQCLQPL